MSLPLSLLPARGRRRQLAANDGNLPEQPLDGMSGGGNVDDNAEEGTFSDSVAQRGCKVDHEPSLDQGVSDPRGQCRIALSHPLLLLLGSSPDLIGSSAVIDHPPLRREVEAHLQTGRRVGAHQEHVRVSVDQGRQMARDTVRVVDLASVPGRPVVLPRQVQFEGVAAPAALQRQVGQVDGAGPFLFVILISKGVIDAVADCFTVGDHVFLFFLFFLLFLLVVEQISRPQSVRPLRLAEILEQQETARHGHAQHLVRVRRDAVGEMTPLQARLAQRLGEDETAAPRAVDVHPQPVAAGDLRNGLEGVERAQDCRARRGVDVERRPTLPLFSHDQCLQRLGVHLSRRGVDGDGDDALAPEPALLRGLLDAVMSMRRGEEDQFAAARVIAQPLRLREQVVARDDDARQVAGAAALDADAAGARAREAEHARQSSRDVRLDQRQHGGHLVHVHVGVEHRQDQLRRHARRQRRRVQLVEKPRARRVHAVLEDRGQRRLQALSARAVFGESQSPVGRQDGVEFGGSMRLDQRAARQLLILMSKGLPLRIGSLNERNELRKNGGEEAVQLVCSRGKTSFVATNPGLVVLRMAGGVLFPVGIVAVSVSSRR